MSAKSVTIAVMLAGTIGYVIGRYEGNNIGVTAAEYRNALASNERLAQNNISLSSEIERMQRVIADTAREINKRQASLKTLDSDIAKKEEILNDKAKASRAWAEQPVPDSISGVLRTKADGKAR